jgi:hypothetical protein
MTDSFKTFARSLTSPAENARALHVGGSGDVAVRIASGGAAAFASLQAGSPADGALVTW